MNFTISHNSPLNTHLLGPGVSYSVSSPGMLQKHTTISRNGATVAEVDWHALSSNVLRMGGSEMRVSDFLHREGVLGSYALCLYI